jgi:hypothetical protein
MGIVPELGWLILGIVSEQGGLIPDVELCYQWLFSRAEVSSQREFSKKQRAAAV